MRIDKGLIVAPTAEGRLIRSQARRSANRVNYRARDSDDFATAVTEIAQMTAMTLSTREGKRENGREKKKEREREREGAFTVVDLSRPIIATAIVP